VAVADNTRTETIRTFGISAELIVTIPNGVDPQRMEPTIEREVLRRRLGIEPDADVIVYLGALAFEKDPLVLLDIIHRIVSQMSRSVAILVGDGPMRRQIEARIDEHRLQGRVLVIGERADVGDLLSAGDILTLTSRTEGMPASLIEAGMARLPVVSYAVGGVPEVVVHGVTGLLVPAGDTRSLGTSLMDLLRDPDRRRAMGEAARAHCLDRFRIDAVARQYLDLYERVATAA
jgi:glycosyltransferase involved in cell wall biosynthesis